jgi:hypothetical protein
VAFDELQMKENVVAFVDSFHDGSPRLYCDRPVVTPEALVTLDPDHVVLASCWHPAMRERLSQVGIPADRVEVFPQWRLVSIDAPH